jgi:hypothetical protein
MYQILGLFDGPSLDGPRSGQSTPFKDGTEGRYEESGKAAVLYGSFLLKVSVPFFLLSPLLWFHDTDSSMLA